MAKSFIMQLASLVTLFVSLPAAVTLIFGIINLQFPDAADMYGEVASAQDTIRYSIAVLAIFFPAYLVLTRLVNKARRGEGELYHKLTKWVIYIALLVGGVVMLTDLAVVVYTFLGGEMTTRFILKALALLVVIGAAFYYYALDAKDHWQKRERLSISIGGGAFLVVLVLIGIGIAKIDTPAKARAINLDKQQITDLEEIQWRVEAYYQQNQSFPANFETLYTDFPAPTAPEEREAYSYRVTGAKSYELCATFAEATPEEERNQPKTYSPGEEAYYQNQNWEHLAGRKCFERTIVSVGQK